MRILLLCSPKVWLEYSYDSLDLQTAAHEKIIKNALPSHRGMDPVCWWVLAVFDSQFNDAFSLQQTRTGAHGKTSHLLHTGDEEIHPAQTAEMNHLAMWKSLPLLNVSIIFFITTISTLVPILKFYMSKQIFKDQQIQKKKT